MNDACQILRRRIGIHRSTILASGIVLSASERRVCELYTEVKDDILFYILRVSLI